MRSGGKILIGLLSGAAAGIAAGLLFAPKKGKDTRKSIATTSDNYYKGAKGKVTDFSDAVNHKIDALKARTKANLTNSKSEEKINEAKAEIHEMKAS
ncbi:MULTISPECIES: YtxH domain-containing protein [unclassified Zunongwangia]|uniref:YtxH domain-containing protein n=1 Tax=unclassified Zunongwangia TaxID=2632541 RepID=UPI0022DE5537|nr:MULTISPECIES: YtxH domain-containing protein [unclassified Zunongwangia]WBL20994.1 YtxH domain-containing protein [Zunongwangia sp. HRR-M8]WBL27130.1 YtxH domain-containing protein [Zunongwangia sp. HGR-M22]